MTRYTNSLIIIITIAKEMSTRKRGNCTLRPDATPVISRSNCDAMPSSKSLNVFKSLYYGVFTADTLLDVLNLTFDPLTNRAIRGRVIAI